MDNTILKSQRCKDAMGEKLIYDICRYQRGVVCKDYMPQADIIF